MRETPLQGSLLIFPARGALAPYLLGGMGVYSRVTESLNGIGDVQSSVVERKTGWHFGLGAELRLARHAALFADYRFRFVKFGQDEPAEGEEPIDFPGLRSLKLTHKGSMWTSGMAFYF
jgi:hypothetical protein